MTGPAPDGTTTLPPAEPTPPTADPTPVAHRSHSRERRGTLVTVGRIVGCFALSRAVVALAIGGVLEIGQGLSAVHFTGPWPAPPEAPLFLQALGSWDGSWYLLIANHGYFVSTKLYPMVPGSAIGFFPVWPLILRGVADVTGLSAIAVGVALAFVFGAAAAVAIWYLVRALCDESVADRSVMLWVFFPGSVVLSMVYSESLLILLSAVCLLALLRRQWWMAGLAAGVATGVHPDAVVLVACCLWAAGVALWRDRDWWSVVAPVLSIGGIVAYFCYLWARTGDLLRWYHVQRSIWHVHTGFAHNTVDVFRTSFAHPHDLQDGIVPAIGLVFVVLGLVAMVQWRPPVLIWIFTLGILVVAFDSNLLGARPRVLLTAFPLVVAVARWTRANWFPAVVGASGVLLGAMTFLLLSLVLVSP